MRTAPGSVHGWLACASLLALAACAGRSPDAGGPATSAGTGATGPIVYEADAFVLDVPDRDPVLCVGAINDSLPPQCDGIPLVDWDWDAVEGEESQSGSTWGSFHVTGTYDGTTFTVVAAASPRPPDPSDEDPIEAPCPEPEGGWISPDVTRATEDDLLALMHWAEDEPDFAGFWIDYVVDPVGEIVPEPGGVIAVAAFTGDVEGHTDEIRERWGGPLCVVQHERTERELLRIQEELGSDAGAELGLEVTWSAGDVVRNRVEVGVVVADDEMIRAVQERYGEEAVLLVPALVPVVG